MALMYGALYNALVAAGASTAAVRAASEEVYAHLNRSRASSELGFADVRPIVLGFLAGLFGLLIAFLVAGSGS